MKHGDIVNKTPSQLLEDGYIKVGGKSHCEYWKKGDQIIIVNTYDVCNQPTADQVVLKTTLQQCKTYLLDSGEDVSVLLKNIEYCLSKLPDIKF